MHHLRITGLRSLADIEAAQDEWADLYARAAPSNPFTHPVWLTCWARAFVPPTDLRVLFVRDAEGTLVAVAPFYCDYRRLGAHRVVTRWCLLGMGRYVHHTELPQVLIAPGWERRVWRALMAWLSERRHEWDWLELSLPPAQGWFEPEWLPDRGPGAGCVVMPTGARPCVVVPLPATWDAFLAERKHNVKESIRRGRNRLRRDGRHARLVVPATAEAVDAATEAVIQLHKARADLSGTTPHSDYVAENKEQAFLRGVVRRLFECDALTPYLLEVDGEQAAGALVLRAQGTWFVALSGFSPQWWSYSVATTLLADIMRAAIEQGASVMNLAVGPNVAKLRWSEQLSTGHDFIVVGPRASSRLLFTLFWTMRSTRWNQRAAGPPLP